MNNGNIYVKQICKVDAWIFQQMLCFNIDEMRKSTITQIMKKT